MEASLPWSVSLHVHVLQRAIASFSLVSIGALAVAGCGGGARVLATPRAGTSSNPPLAVRVSITIGGQKPLVGQRMSRHVSNATNGVLIQFYPAGTTTPAFIQGYDVSAASPACAPAGLGRTCSLSLVLNAGVYDVAVTTYDAIVSPNGVVPGTASALDRGLQSGQVIARNAPNIVNVALSGVVGVVTTIAGQAMPGLVNGIGTAAQFNTPTDVAVDYNGYLYVTEDLNHTVRKIAPNGTVTTLAGAGTSGYTDGMGAIAKFNSPQGVAVDGAGNNVYVADTTNNIIRQINAAGTVSTLAGQLAGGFTNATGTSAQFSSPNGVAVDNAGNVYVTDTSNNAVRLVTPGGVVTTYAGQAASGFLDATGSAAQFNNPFGIAIDRGTGVVYVADSGNNAIRKIAPGGAVTTLAGSMASGFLDGIGTAARLYNPTSLAVDVAGNVYVADANNNAIRKITPAGVVSTLAGTTTSGFVNALGSAASFSSPLGVAVDLGGNVYVADSSNNAIRAMK